MTDEHEKITVELTIEQIRFIIRCIQLASPKAESGLNIVAQFRKLNQDAIEYAYQAWAEYDLHEAD